MTMHEESGAEQQSMGNMPILRARVLLLSLLALVVLLVLVFWVELGIAEFTGMSRQTVGRLLFAAYCTYLLSQRIAAGSLLVDCRSHPGRKLALIVGSLVLLLIIVDVAPLLVEQEIDWPEVVGELGMLPVVAFLLIQGFSRLQLRQHGILCYDELVRWRAIEEHHWKGEANYNLIVQFKRPVRMLGRKARFSVPTELVETVEARITECRTEPT